MVDFPQGIKDMTRRCGRASFTVELGNRLAIGPAAEDQAARQSNQRLLAIVHVSGYTGFESAAQRLSPTSPSSGQATSSCLLRHSALLTCHLGAPLGGRKARGQLWNLPVTNEHIHPFPALRTMRIRVYRSPSGRPLSKALFHSGSRRERSKEAVSDAKCEAWAASLGGTGYRQDGT
jgi:hypothetical protein